MKLLMQDKITPRWPTRIRAHRRKLKLTQTEYGELFGVTPAAVSDWERGKYEAPYIVTWMIYKAGLLK